MSDQTPSTTSRKPTTREWGTMVLGIAVIAVSLANRNKVKVDWIVATWRIPLIILIVACLAIGGASGYYVGRRREKSSKD